MLRGLILKQHDIPTTPVVPDQVEEVLMFHLRPPFTDPQQRTATADIERAMQDAPGVAAARGDSDLLTDAAITAVQRRRLRNDRLIQHQQSQTGTRKKPGF